jgi:hypothetical protein
MGSERLQLVTIKQQFYQLYLMIELLAYWMIKVL